MVSTKTCRRIIAATGVICLFAAPASSYDRKAAVDYSDRYWGGDENEPRYNTRFFAIYPNDCANFVSQTVMAGNLRFANAMGEIGQNGTMIRANELGSELATNHGATTVVDYDDPDSVTPNLPSGDPIFIMRLLNASRTYWVEVKTHAMLLSAQSPLAFTAHSNNRVRYPIGNIDDPIFTDFAFAIGLNWLRYFHIPTGPIVKYIALSQVQQGQTRLLREYFYDDDYDPEVKFGEYYAHTYNGLNKVTLEDGVASRGELRIKVVFDSTMNEDSLVAAFGKMTPFTNHRFTTVSWSTTHQPLDTWEGRINIDATIADGPQTISIDGRSADGSPLDSDGDLAVYNPGPDTTQSFAIDLTAPQIAVNSREGFLDDGAVTSDPYITIFSVDGAGIAASGLREIKVFKETENDDLILFRESTGPLLPEEPYPANSWYYVRSCDKADNCGLSLFGIFEPGKDPPSPPGAPPLPPGSPPYTPPAGTPKKPRPFPDQPPCLLASVDLSGGLQNCLPSFLPGLPPPFAVAPGYGIPKDPNAKHGTSGSVVAGQLMTYTIEFENEGTGKALGVYIKDTLDPSLDDTTLVLRDFQAVDYANNTSAPASFPWSYDDKTRTVTVLAGEAGPRKGGRFTLKARLRADVTQGIIIANQAVVYFPNALEITPTNTVVAAVALPTQLDYVGPSSGTYLDAARLIAKLGSTNRALPGQAVEFKLGLSTQTAPTDDLGAASAYAALLSTPGTYALEARYPGDGFYYAPSSTRLDFLIEKRGVLLGRPQAQGRLGEKVTVAIAVADDKEQPLLRQAEEPKSVRLELVKVSGEASLLAQALLAGTSVQFEFDFPRLSALTATLRARFEGDAFYATTESSGTLRLIDETDPLVSIASPQEGRTYSGSESVAISFSAQDEADPSPLISASLVPQGGGPSRPVTNGESLPASSLEPGAWALLVEAVDWAGNRSQATVNFQILSDALPPRTSLVIGQPRFGTSPLFISTQTPVGFTAVDDRSVVGDGQGLGVLRTEYTLDGGSTTLFVSDFFLAGEGIRSLSFLSVDLVGNQEAPQTASLSVDATPPASSLVIGSPNSRTAQGELLVSPRTLFSLTAIDPVVNGVASGVSQTFYRLSTGTFTPALSAFTLSGPDSPRSIEFYSEDNVLNTEVVHSSAVVLDATAPEITLLSPKGSGICSVVKGRLLVLGSALDAHLKDYRLEVAVGSAAVSGFTLISSGTAGIASGVLGTWDTGEASGWQTLRLTATDLVGNAAQVNMNVFVGDPGELLSLGNHEMFDLPEGVAVNSSGAIYVADRNNNRIAVFSSTGTLLASLGGREHDEGQHGKLSTGTLRLNKPSGVAVDEMGQVYVADTNNDRVVKLSSAGVLLLELGRQGKKGDDVKPGKGPGEFNKPSGVAVDPAGNIYVSDRENRRVQVFSSTGALTLQIPLPPVTQKHGDDDDKEEAGKPAGIAIDTAGMIYVADPKGGRVLTFSAAGTLLRSLPIFDEDGKRGHPFGVAVTPSGDCLLISDRKHSLIFKFDVLGHQTLVFGGKHKKKNGIAFNKPLGLALDVEGNLYVAERNNDKIRKFGLPTGRPALVVPPARPEDEHVARAVVDTEEGGKVLRKDKAGVIVPAEALAEDLKITVSRPQESKGEEKARHGALAEKELKVVSPPVSYAPHGTQFEAPVTLVLPYNANLAQAQKADEDSLQVHYWNEKKGEWEALESKVNEKDKTVTAKTKHFSLYQVLAGSSTQTQALRPLAADPSFAFRDLYVFPNPARAGAKPTIHLAVGIADKVSIRIYDVSGREVHQATLYEQPAIINDGGGDQYAYEYAWDGRIASGVYLYIIEAEKQGYGTIRKTGKFGVVR